MGARMAASLGGITGLKAAVETFTSEMGSGAVSPTGGESLRPACDFAILLLWSADHTYCVSLWML